MKDYICPKCNQQFDTKWKLTKHLERQYPCTEGKYACDKCPKKFNHSSNLSAHKKICKGKCISTADKDKKIDNLETVLAATGNQRDQHAASQTNNQRNIHNGSGDIINGDQINNIQNNTNVFVLPIGQENIDHLRKMSIHDLQERIGLRSDPSTMIKLFELIRTDEDHPENHTMLLPDIDGHIIHCKNESGWTTDTFNNSMQRALHSDNSFLIRKLPDNFADKSFQDGYIMNEIQQKINFCDHDALKAIYDGIRGSLHDLTMKLAERHKDMLSSAPNQTVSQPESEIEETEEILQVRQELLETKLKKLLKQQENLIKKTETNR